MSTFWAMSIAHSFMSILIHRAGFMSIARYEFYDNIGSMYELCSYYDTGFIMDELSSYISCMTFIMIPIGIIFNTNKREYSFFQNVSHSLCIKYFIFVQMRGFGFEFHG